jgi:transcriptional regulator with XRE-family HTH domain
LKSLREWRAARLESSKTLAVKAGVSNKTILEIENGRNVPTFRTIRRLSEALNVDPAEVEEFAAAIEERGKDAA